jgi:hypothetical protein
MWMWKDGLDFLAKPHEKRWSPKESHHLLQKGEIGGMSVLKI